MTAIFATAQPLLWSGFRSSNAARRIHRNLSDRQTRPLPIEADFAGVFATSNLPNWYSAAIQRLMELTELPDGWDGYDGVAVGKDIAIYAETVLSRVLVEGTPKASIVPMSHGGVQIEWHTLTADLELTFLAPYEIDVSFKPVGGQTEETEIGQDVEPIKAYFEKLSA